MSVSPMSAQSTESTPSTLSIAQRWTEQSRKSPRRILLPEAEDPRMLRAAAEALALGVCKPEFVGSPDKIAAAARDANVAVPDVPIHDPTTHPRFEEFCATYAV